MKTRRLVALTTLMLLVFSSSTTILADNTPFWRRVLRFFGVASNPGKQKGDGDKVISGRIRITDLETGSQEELTTGSGFQSPIFLPTDDAVLALKDKKIVKITLATKQIQVLRKFDDITKLVGLETMGDSPNPKHLLILSDTDRDGCPSVGVINLKNFSLEKLEYGTEDQTMVNHLQDWNRVYDDGALEFQVRLTEKNRGQVKWTDVFLRRNDTWTNVTKCEPVMCGHPSISHNRKKVVFIKSN